MSTGLKMASLMSGIAGRLGSTGIVLWAPTQSLSNKEVSESLDFHVTQGSQRLRSKQQEEEAASILRPGSRNWHFIIATIFYWSSSQKAHPDARGGNIHPTSHSREDGETKINHKIDTL